MKKIFIFVSLFLLLFSVNAKADTWNKIKKNVSLLLQAWNTMPASDDEFTAAVKTLKLPFEPWLVNEFNYSDTNRKISKSTAKEAGLLLCEWNLFDNDSPECILTISWAGPYTGYICVYDNKFNLIFYKRIHSGIINELSLLDIDSDGQDEIICKISYHQPGYWTDKLLILQFVSKKLVTIFDTIISDDNPTGGEKWRLNFGKNDNLKYSITKYLEESYIIYGPDRKKYSNIDKRNKTIKYIWNNKKRLFVEQIASQ